MTPDLKLFKMSERLLKVGSTSILFQCVARIDFHPASLQNKTHKYYNYNQYF